MCLIFCICIELELQQFFNLVWEEKTVAANKILGEVFY